MRQVRNGDGALVSGETGAAAGEVADGAAEQQADAGEAPDGADARDAPRWNTRSPNSANRIWAAPPPMAQPTEIRAIPIISGTERM